jgi:hypothetical protein
MTFKPNGYCKQNAYSFLDSSGTLEPAGGASAEIIG